MSNKIAGLDYLAAKFREYQFGLKAYIYKLPAYSEKTDDYLQRLGEMVLFADECECHVWSLQQLNEHIVHGLHGTMPEGYDPTEVLDDEPVGPYDPYAEMLRIITLDVGPCPLVLSARLKRAIQLLPVAEQQAFAKRPADLVECYVNPDGSVRPMTEQEITTRQDAHHAELMVHTEFTVTYAADMAQLHRLATQRGNLKEMLLLIGPPF